MTPAPNDAVLSEADYEKALDDFYEAALIDWEESDDDNHPAAMRLKDTRGRIDAHDAALRAKLAERDRLLARCEARIEQLTPYFPLAPDVDLLADIRAALEGGPR